MGGLGSDRFGNLLIKICASIDLHNVPFNGFLLVGQVTYFFMHLLVNINLFVNGTTYATSKLSYSKRHYISATNKVYARLRIQFDDELIPCNKIYKISNKTGPKINFKTRPCCVSRPSTYLLFFVAFFVICGNGHDAHVSTTVIMSLK